MKVSRKRKTKKLQPGQAVAANPGGSQLGGPQPGGAQVAAVQQIHVEDEFDSSDSHNAAVQPGIVPAAATQPGVRRGTYPGKSLLKKGSTRPRRKPKDKKLPAAAAKPGGPQPEGPQPGGPQPGDAQTVGVQVAAVQPGGVQAAAAKPGVGRGAYPGKSLLKKGKNKKLPNVFVTLDKAHFPAEEPLFVRNWFIHRPFADKEKGEKELDFVVHETYLTEKAPKKLEKVQVVPIQGHEMIFNRVKLEENGIKMEHVEDEFDSSDNEVQENEIDLEYWSSDSDDEEALTEGTAVEL